MTLPDALLMTPEQVAEVLQVPLSSARELMHEIGAIKLGQRLRVRRDRFEAWLASKEVGARSAPTASNASAKPARAIRPIKVRTKPRP